MCTIHMKEVASSRLAELAQTGNGGHLKNLNKKFIGEFRNARDNNKYNNFINVATIKTQSKQKQYDNIIYTSEIIKALKP